ncbi:PstS family phosphate ABC transporter substrate-binding protein [Streptomyces lunaelactis]|nr:PstS family phosphate ABC transporter substrate-binding protein [Streptomyces lunaelactis]NUK07735.1 PstS family phosphate ABC transporter substrate-binding protein [Streptomyces lunaelactis]NUK15843.1 PstS family phosphate ABC transporter substrate-binding protein [Streptomyces lunaelactis]NUK23627.1 PstS family phosphate ABC transporter substrate-binding protein [Streptomyces lunaelactis]NUK33872.1 PstS family phosphate ABC transporter substrate-binding protein [Streptomyces lunaelactis]
MPASTPARPQGSRKVNAASGSRRFAGPAALAFAAALTLSACGGGDSGSTSGSAVSEELSGKVTVDGSSTVAPLSTAAAELFAEEQPKVQVTVGTSGTGGGFEKFCNGETDISDASRPIEPDEKAACDKKGITYDELTVANDALTVVVNKDADWVDCLTVAQLKKIWEPKSTVNNWNQVDPTFPSVPLKLFGAGTDSGTFDYFTEVINGEEGASRTDYSPTEDDNVTVQGVAGSDGGMGYFGFSYFEENQDKLKALKINAGDGCVAPGVETAQNGTYKPLSRPLFIYPSAKALERPEAEGYVEYYVENNQDIAKDAKFIPLNATQEKELQADLEKLKSSQ